MRVLLFSALLSAGIVSSASASSLAVDFSDPSSQNPHSDWSLGFSFTANSDVSVVALGTYDYQQDGLAAPQQVGLWDSSPSHLLLASVFVDNSDPLQGFWRFGAITPITLTAGSTYFVAAQGGEGYTWYTSGFKVDPAITYLRDAWHYTTTANSPLAFPDITENISAADGGASFGANFEIASTAAPEPSSMALFGLGMAAIGLGRRRRSQARTATK